ncbi:MmcQ/YjbR family DNA-binding protein [Streptomyces sp. NPDC048603]|uniref:MmcQ/YjbR family DNA-binding protein n=1 Tax=Streptomyces sp. NPDC048603 TaxID=3365577 RepID=UPI00370FAED4
MTPAELRAFCLGLNAAAEEFPFNPETSVFKVLGKMFALSQLDGEPLKVSLKCDPEEAVRLRAEHEAVAPGWHLNKRHWNTVTVDGSLPDRMVRELIEDSYDLVVAGLPRAERLRLDRP